MPDGVGSQRAGTQQLVSALRTALVGRAVLRFDGPGVDGPSPALGRVIERVQRRGRGIQIVWDDGLILHTQLGLSGVWHLYREGEPWRKPFADVRVAITVPGWVAACFKARHVETYREFDRHRHPGFGRSAPDLTVTAVGRADQEITRNLSRGATDDRRSAGGRGATAPALDGRGRVGGGVDGVDVARDPEVVDCARRLGDYADREASVAEALLDPHVAFGIGNVYRCETLWRCGVHPFARVGDLSAPECVALLATAAAMLRHNAEQAAVAAPVDTRDEMVVYGRNGQRCTRCGDTIEVRRVGWPQRMLYWCAGCQVAHDPDRVVAAAAGGGAAGDIPVGIAVDDRSDEARRALSALVMDPHPAAAMFVADLPWRRTGHTSGADRTGGVDRAGGMDRGGGVDRGGAVGRASGVDRVDRPGGVGRGGGVDDTGGAGPTDRIDRAG